MRLEYLDRSTVSESLKLSGIYEIAESYVVADEIKAGDVVLDIGAHIGYYTTLFSSLVRDRGRVYAFEPYSESFILLKKNIRFGRFHNVFMIRKAVLDINGTTRLFLNAENRADNRIFENNWNSEIIEAVRLDDFFKDSLDRLDFVKMDTQGTEAKIVLGMERLLRKHKGVKLFLEFWPFGMKRTSSHEEINQAFTLLLLLGFKAYLIDRKLRELVRIPFIELWDLADEEDSESFVNLIFKR